MPRRSAAIDLADVLAEALSSHTPISEDLEGEVLDRFPPPDHNSRPTSPSLDDRDDVEAMMDATSGLLAGFGLRRWTMDDVAERCGLGRATVYRRFESRDRLVRATLVRDARRFFEAVTASVAGVHSFTEKVIEGFVAGLDLLHLSPFPQLLRNDPGAATALLVSESTLKACTRALVESYERLAGVPVRPSELARVEAVAEALIRLGTSMLLTPGTLTGGGTIRPTSDDLSYEVGGADIADRDERMEMRLALAWVIAPLTSSPPGQPADRQRHRG